MTWEEFWGPVELWVIRREKERRRYGVEKIQACDGRGRRDKFPWCFIQYNTRWTVWLGLWTVSLVNSLGRGWVWDCLLPTKRVFAVELAASSVSHSAVRASSFIWPEESGDGGREKFQQSSRTFAQLWWDCGCCSSSLLCCCRPRDGLASPALHRCCGSRGRWFPRSRFHSTRGGNLTAALFLHELQH